MGGIGERVQTMIVYNQELVVGGYFARAGGNWISNIARWNGLTWQPLAGGTEHEVLDLTEFEGELIAGGSFRTVNGLSAHGVAAWNGSSWRSLGSGIRHPSYPPVETVATHANSLYAGGFFSTAGPWGAANWAKWGCPPCIGDLNDSGVVDLSDLATLLAHFATESTSFANGDMDSNGIVDVSDLALLLANFALNCP
jgi:hypothetical protein